MQNIVNESKQNRYQDAITVIGGSDEYIGFLYSAVKADWQRDHPDEPLPNLIITHDEHGHPMMSALSETSE